MKRLTKEIYKGFILLIGKYVARACIVLVIGLIIGVPIYFLILSLFHALFSTATAISMGLISGLAIGLLAFYRTRKKLGDERQLLNTLLSEIAEVTDQSLKDVKKSIKNGGT
jgi:uncharacterized membrane protein